MGKELNKIFWINKVFVAFTHFLETPDKSRMILEVSSQFPHSVLVLMHYLLTISSFYICLASCVENVFKGTKENKYLSEIVWFGEDCKTTSSVVWKSVCRLRSSCAADSLELIFNNADTLILVNYANMILSFIALLSFISIQPWRPGLAGTRAQSCDRYGSGTLHPGQVLRGSLPLFSPAFRRYHFSRQVPPYAMMREILAAKGGTVGEKDIR